jgi:Lrp/AsnC family transcriptional regulator for asnA, asnC and gidA
MGNENDELDEIDIQILKLLQKNSRMSIADIAREIDKLTENAIRYRIEKLEEEGYIKNYTIRLNPKKFSKEVIAILDLNVLPEYINDALDFLKSIEFLNEIYLTTGRYPITIIGQFEDNKAVTKFITDDLKKIQLIDYEVSTVLQRVKHELFGI